MESLIDAYLEQKTPFSSAKATRIDIKGENIVVNFNYGDFQRFEGYEISLLVILEFMWQKIQRLTDES